ncbi:SDR family NAD(P)-dependent oxidoreductase [Vibrio sp. TBV020]|uniref:SDR family NAD(P)-dependent oxidoreductase n=1 Tax=Vibrio sp. TBV020 TaxID=3137398 RepID=UPI0038CD8079
MQKVILVTGATDGIGFETAKVLVEQGHHVLVHGRSPSKLKGVEEKLSALGKVSSYVADLSNLAEVDTLTDTLKRDFSNIDVVINNAGVYATNQPATQDGFDVRFVVNTLAPYKLAKALLPIIPTSGRVVNLSSAAQASVNIDALNGKKTLGDGEAYAQSKLALTMWSRHLGLENREQGPIIVSVNPKSFLGSKMVKEAYGVAGNDLSLGADILVRASLSDEFNQAAGLYFDNDVEAFADPHPDALNQAKVNQVVEAIDALI